MITLHYLGVTVTVYLMGSMQVLLQRGDLVVERKVTHELVPFGHGRLGVFDAGEDTERVSIIDELHTKLHRIWHDQLYSR